MCSYWQANSQDGQLSLSFNFSGCFCIQRTDLKIDFNPYFRGKNGIIGDSVAVKIKSKGQRVSKTLMISNSQFRNILHKASQLASQDIFFDVTLFGGSATTIHLFDNNNGVTYEVRGLSLRDETMHSKFAELTILIFEAAELMQKPYYN